MFRVLLWTGGIERRLIVMMMKAGDGGHLYTCGLCSDTNLDRANNSSDPLLARTDVPKRAVAAKWKPCSTLPNLSIVNKRS